MKMIKNIYVIWTVLIIVIAVVVYIFTNNTVNDDVMNQGNISEDRRTTTTIIGDVSIELPEGATITNIPIENETVVETPNLDRQVIFPSFYNTEAKQIIGQKIEIAISALEEDPTSFGYWLDLGSLRNNIEDYEGAIEIYEYLNIAAPTNSLSFSNLGNIYHLYIKDFEKAEKNLRQAVSNSPSNIHAVRSLYELYRFSYKQETTLAEDTLLQGLEDVSNQIDLIILLATFYKDVGRNTDAQIRYEEAKELATIDGNDSLLLLIEGELNDLK